MSREIKFRAWVKMYDDSDGVMLNMPMNIHHFDFEDGIVISFTDYPEFYGHENYDHRNPKLPHEINIMQYTGLKDKNGKEIYEGDIIIIDNKHASLGNDIIKTVLFKNGMFGVSEDVYSFISLKEFFVGVESTKKYISNYGEIFEEYKAVVEVIGNIYENPELITGVKNG